MAGFDRVAPGSPGPVKTPKNIMKTATISLSLALLGGAIAAAHEPKKPPGHRPPPPPLITALDADRDGIISAEEIENAPTALLTLDKNKDGELTREELHPHGPPPPGGRRPPGGEPEQPSEAE